MNLKAILFLLVIPFFITCSQQERFTKIVSGNFEFGIPDKFELLENNTKTSEILRIMYKNEMYFLVQTDLNETLKKSILNKKSAMLMSHKIKFEQIKKAYQGYETTEFEWKNKGGNLTLCQEFLSDDKYGTGMYTVCIVNVENDFLSVLVGGRKELRKPQVRTISFFLSEMKYLQ